MGTQKNKKVITKPEIVIDEEWPRYKKELVQAYIESGKPIDEIQWYIDNNDSDVDWFDVYVGFTGGLTIEQINLYAQQDFDMGQRGLIRRSLIQGTSIDKLKLYAFPRIEYQNMEAIDNAVRHNTLTDAQIKFVAKYARRYSKEQLMEMIEGFKDGLSEKEVESYVREWLSASKMVKERYKLSHKKKDEYYKDVVRRDREEFFSTKTGMTIQGAIVLSIFIVFILLGIYLMTNPTFFATYPLIESMLWWIANAVESLFIAIAIVDFVRGVFIFSSPHPDTFLGHIINAILFAGLIMATSSLLPNVMMVMGFEFLIIAINRNIYQYLRKIKYHS